MKIAILTTDEPFYLPNELAFILRSRSQDDVYRVLMVAPEHYDVEKKKRERVATRVLRSFGFVHFVRLSCRALIRKFRQYLPRRETDERFDSIASVCRTFSVPLDRVDRLNSDRTVEMLSQWGVDLMVSLSCPQVLRKRLIETAPRGVLNLHCSPLPNYRGLYPAFWMLKNGESEAAATLFFVDEGIDSGDVLIQRRFPIEPDETLHAFTKKSKRIGSQCIVDGIEMIRAGNYETRSMDLEAGSYFSWPTREDVKAFRRTRRLV